MISRRTIVALALASGLSAGLSFATPASAAMADKDLAAALRAGGLVIVVRHGATYANQADTDTGNFDDVAKQRNLDDRGKAQAAAFGDALRQIGAPVGDVFTSRLNRAYQTAVLAGLKDVQKSVDFTEVGGMGVSPDENARRNAALRKIISTPPKPGTNTIIVTHKPNIIDALGKDWFDVKEGEASIFKPEGESYTLLARLQVEDWTRVAAAK